jgi:hypothetical protein
LLAASGSGEGGEAAAEANEFLNLAIGGNRGLRRGIGPFLNGGWPNGLGGLFRNGPWLNAPWGNGWGNGWPNGGWLNWRGF